MRLLHISPFLSGGAARAPFDSGSLSFTEVLEVWLMEGGIPEAGAAIAGIMTKKLSRLVPQNACAEVKSRVVARLKAFYERFRNLGAD
ncbi:hypothetical protein [Collinsella tanakaei]|uniref:hypothetical protein n=1 Tax=Collinsella tanakaei TaxID=626935 RepID=UPI0026E98B54|nr:hypothetical protein [Collinsella tanakaei]